MFITTHRKIFFTLTGIIAALSLVSIFAFGLHLSIDFTGGSLAVANYPAGRPPVAALEQSLSAAGFHDYALTEDGTTGYDMRAQTLTDTQRANLTQTLSVGGSYPAT
jgi:preprotein translocase subunit SecF